MRRKLNARTFLHTSAVQHSGRSSMQPESPVPATPSSAHARTMRRNIRGETPLHIAAIKVGPSLVIITFELIQFHCTHCGTFVPWLQCLSLAVLIWGSTASNRYWGLKVWEPGWKVYQCGDGICNIVLCRVIWVQCGPYYSRELIPMLKIMLDGLPW